MHFNHIHTIARAFCLLIFACLYENNKNKHLFKGIAFGFFKNLKNTFTILIMLKHL